MSIFLLSWPLAHPPARSSGPALGPGSWPSSVHQFHPNHRVDRASQPPTVQRSSGKNMGNIAIENQFLMDFPMFRNDLIYLEGNTPPNVQPFGHFLHVLVRLVWLVSGSCSVKPFSLASLTTSENFTPGLAPILVDMVDIKKQKKNIHSRLTIIPKRIPCISPWISIERLRIWMRLYNEMLLDSLKSFHNHWDHDFWGDPTSKCWRWRTMFRWRCPQPVWNRHQHWPRYWPSARNGEAIDASLGGFVSGSLAVSTSSPARTSDCTGPTTGSPAPTWEIHCSSSELRTHRHIYDHFHRAITGRYTGFPWFSPEILRPNQK